MQRSRTTGLDEKKVSSMKAQDSSQGGHETHGREETRKRLELIPPLNPEESEFYPPPTPSLPMRGPHKNTAVLSDYLILISTMY